MLALPAKAIVKLRPGSVFEALQSCCLAFCNVLLVWLAPGLLLACPWLACLSCLVRSRWPWLAPGLLLACSLLASGLSWLLLACYWLALALFLLLVLACSWLASALLLECSWPAPGMLLGCFLLRAWITLGLGKARSKPGAGQERATPAIHCKMQGNSSARLQKHCQGATLRLLSLAGPTQNLQS